MVVVAIIAVLLAMLIPTARMGINREDPGVGEIVATVWMMIAESVVVYYAVLAVALARDMIPSARMGTRLRPLLLYGPVLFVVGIVLLLMVLDAIP